MMRTTMRKARGGDGSSRNKTGDLSLHNSSLQSVPMHACKMSCLRQCAIRCGLLARLMKPASRPSIARVGSSHSAWKVTCGASGIVSTSMLYTSPSAGRLPGSAIKHCSMISSTSAGTLPVRGGRTPASWGRRVYAVKCCATSLHPTQHQRLPARVRSAASWGVLVSKGGLSLNICAPRT